MFEKTYGKKRGRDALTVSGLGKYSLTDTLLCGQCFRYEPITENEDYNEYMTVVGKTLLFVGQERLGELIFYGVDDEIFNKVIRPYFTLDTDYEAIKDSIVKSTDSPWLIRAAECSEGIAILKQDPWETLFSFIISPSVPNEAVRGGRMARTSIIYSSAPAAGAALAISAAAAAVAGNPAQCGPLALIHPRHVAPAPGALHIVPGGDGAQQIKPMAALHAPVIVYRHDSSDAQKERHISIAAPIIHDLPASGKPVYVLITVMEPYEPAIWRSPP